MVVRRCPRHRWVRCKENHRTPPSSHSERIADLNIFSLQITSTAKLHVAALLDDSVDKQRFYGASGSFGAVVFQQAVKAAKPNFKEKDYSAFPAALTIPLDNKASEALLRKHYGHGFKNLTDSVREALVEAWMVTSVLLSYFSKSPTYDLATDAVSLSVDESHVDRSLFL